MRVKTADAAALRVTGMTATRIAAPCDIAGGGMARTEARGADIGAPFDMVRLSVLADPAKALVNPFSCL
jgi:hypothetical protein